MADERKYKAPGLWDSFLNGAGQKKFFDPGNDGNPPGAAPIVSGDLDFLAPWRRVINMLAFTPKVPNAISDDMVLDVYGDASGGLGGGTANITPGADVYAPKLTIDKKTGLYVERHG